MDFSVINTELVVTLLLLLLIGVGPKIALVPFLEKTKGLDPEKQREVGQLMVKTAIVAALVVFATGGLLLKLLHITTGAVAVAGGIILGLLAIKMALGPAEEVVDEGDLPVDHAKMAIYPLAVPFLFNPVGVTVLIIASSEAQGVATHALVVALVLVVGAFDWLVFSNIDKIGKRLNPTSLVISEVVFGILLTAVAVQLVVSGLNGLGIIETGGAHH
ncbi:MAG: MarC family protein [Pseudomonadota bacterium]